MSATDGAFAQWLCQAQIAERRLTAEQRGLLQFTFAFRERCGDDYYSNRLLSHFLLHCDCGLKVAQIARLVGISRPTASHQQGISSKEAIQAAHHRMAGRPHGKLLPRYAGPIAEFILTHADATRYDLLDFIERIWGVRVSTVAWPSAGHTPAEPRSIEPVPPVPPTQPVPLPPPPFSRRGRSTLGRSC